MINVFDMMALKEASTGYVGGNYVDEMKDMSLTECTAALPIAITEAQLDIHDSVRRQNDAILEATMMAIRTGSMSEAALDNINELSFKDIKAKIIAIFNKIKKFLRSIIDKITLQIDKIRMTGKQLWSKYGKSDALKDTSKFKDFTFEGYKFPKKVKFNSFDDEKGAENLVKAAYGGDPITPSDASAKFQNMIHDISRAMPQKNDESDDDVAIRRGEEVDKIIEKLTDVSKGDRISSMANKLTGMSDLGDDWKETVRKEVYGDKETLNYGSDFTVDSIGKICQNPTDIDAIKKEYVRLEQAVSKYENSLTKELDFFKKDGSQETANDRVAYNKIVSYYNKYMDVLSDAYATITAVKNIRVGAAQAESNQAKTILGKLISLGGKKSKTEDIDIDDELMFELDM